MNKVFTMALLLFIFISCAQKTEKAVSEESAQQSETLNNPVATIETNKGTITIELWPNIAPMTVENFTGLANGTKEWTDPKTGEKVTRPFYDGLIFHRVINDFMIQGGCPLGDGRGGPGYRFEDETHEHGEKIKGKIADEDTALTVFQKVILPYLNAAQGDPEKIDPEIQAIVERVMGAQSGEAIMEKTVEYFIEKTGYEGEVYTQGRVKAPVGYGTIAMANSGPNTNGSQFFIVTKKGGTPWLDGKHTVFGKVIEGMDVVHEIENSEKGPQDKPVNDITMISVRAE